MLFLPETITEAASRIWDDLDAEKIAPESAYNQLLALNPQDYAALLATADLRHEAGDDAGAEDYYWRAVAAQPCLWDAWVDLAHLVEARGEPEFSNGLAELGLRRLLADPEARIEMIESPRSFDDYSIAGLEIPVPEERITAMAEVMRNRRDREPGEVTARLRPLRLLLELQDAEELGSETVDAIVREGEAMVPLLIGLLRSYAQSDLLDSDEATVGNALALMGEIGSATAFPALLEFSSLQDSVLSGAAAWAFDRIIELHPEESGQALLALAPALDGSQRLALAERLAYWPRFSVTDRLFEILPENADTLPPEQRGTFFYAMTMSMIVAKRREGLQMARRMLRRNAGLLDRAARRECEQQIEVFSEMGGQALRALEAPERSAWTVYQICAGEAEWPSDDEELEEDAFEEDGIEEDWVPEPLPRPVLPGRNDPCWCGSGKKYKKCHLDADRASTTPF